MTVDKLTDFWDKLPNYAQLLITVGGFVFYTAMLFSDVQHIKEEQKRINDAYATNARVAAQVVAIQEQIRTSEKMQDRTTVAFENLADSLNRLSVNLARLEGRLDYLEKKKK